MTGYVQCFECWRVIADDTDEIYCDCGAEIDRNCFPLMCAKCFVPLFLKDGCEWPQEQRLYCWACAHERLKELEQNNGEAVE